MFHVQLVKVATNSRMWLSRAQLWVLEALVGPGRTDADAAGLTDAVGMQALRMASELECSGVYLGSCRMGCMLKGCLLFMDIMMAEVRGLCPSSSFGSVLVGFFWRGHKNTSERKRSGRARAQRASHSERGGIKKEDLELELLQDLLPPRGLPVTCIIEMLLPPADILDRCLLIGQRGWTPRPIRWRDPGCGHALTRLTGEEEGCLKNMLFLETFENRYVCPHQKVSY